LVGRTDGTPASTKRLCAFSPAFRMAQPGCARVAGLYCSRKRLLSSRMGCFRRKNCHRLRSGVELLATSEISWPLLRNSRRIIPDGPALADAAWLGSPTLASDLLSVTAPERALSWKGPTLSVTRRHVRKDQPMFFLHFEAQNLICRLKAHCPQSVGPGR
jgi:hypothetical protein